MNNCLLPFFVELLDVLPSKRKHEDDSDSSDESSDDDQEELDVCT
jgi:origin recognition complex subunit 6